MVPQIVRMRIGQRFRLARQALGATLQNVGDACGVTRQAVSLWETGKSIPSNDVLERAATFLGVASYWLLTGDQPTPGASRRRLPW